MRETASGRRQAPLNVTSSLDAARELGIRDAQEWQECFFGGFIRRRRRVLGRLSHRSPASG